MHRLGLNMQAFKDLLLESIKLLEMGHFLQPLKYLQQTIERKWLLMNTSVEKFMIDNGVYDPA